MNIQLLSLRPLAAAGLTATLLGSLLASRAEAQFVLDEHLASVGIDDVEITPDGRYAIARESSLVTMAHVFDVATGALLATVTSGGTGAFPTTIEDGVAVTNDRAVVLGLSALVIDLSGPSISLINSLDLGVGPRDVAITPDGSKALVRGGTGPNGGLFVIDLATATILANAPGNPSDPLAQAYTFTVDSVAATNDHAVFTSFVQGTSGPENGRRTRVSIFELNPLAGPPALVFETTAANDLLGAPHDLVLSPDGSSVHVRSDLTVTRFNLGATPGIAWSSPPAMDPGPFVASALDSIVCTNDRIATISRLSNGAIGAQVDVFDTMGNRWFDTLGGDPHDLEITPDGTGLVVRTSAGVLYYDLTVLPAGNNLVPLSSISLQSTHTSFAAGLDSVIATDDCVVALARSSFDTEIAVYDRDASGLSLRGSVIHPEPPVDLVLTPNGTRAIVSGTSSASVVDLRAVAVTMLYDIPSGSIAWPWSDGVVATDDRAFAFGINTVNFTGGWLTAFDLFSEPTRYCTANVNTTGESAKISVAGSARVGSNDLKMLVSDLPSRVPGFFRVGTSQTSAPFGDGVNCVGSPIPYRPVTFSSVSGVVVRDIDATTTPPGVAFAAGSTWNFQFLYRDNSPTGLNLSDAITVTFEN